MKLYMRENIGPLLLAALLVGLFVALMLREMT